MKILLLGSGGREDALAWRLSQCGSCAELHVAPGNPGMARWADEVHALDLGDTAATVRLAQGIGADLVVVGPEAPLVAGLADALEEKGIACFGPGKGAAMLEGSKSFTKRLCDAAGIPTAAYRETASVEAALAAIDAFGVPVVIKADGLAAGKGVTVATTREEAEAAVRAAGDAPLVIEQFLEGEEASLFALCDGETVQFLASAQDHKRVGEGDTGPNTGGMGAYSPAPVLTDDLARRAMLEIVTPTAAWLAAQGMPYRGVLYAGLMLTPEGPKLIEYNVRFGDPECQAIMPRIAGDLAATLRAVAEGRLAEADPLALEEAHVMTVVVAAKGYPARAASGGAIEGIEAAEAEGAIVFQAGTARAEDGTLVASGGRVLNVTAAGASLADARAGAYAALDRIEFGDGFARRDIGWRELERDG
ncbi:phosphoribosylamine--glycine ligase [Sphingomicrobium astaxanthinifaciens]|uniref:phosphoribosylamine--glycine ligase n=1 Tax=Sphingomicrobium astaxanthinifaciens TaxID=1227949 RepID=UPI001FCBC376|nr:phosphoribosylamine--glycine ligase [Sphingomicrobium astaxanthinifaciens]MCJ7421397.1 phosphoribosylamine--glycine ligase [Sphingomicrobium astaxanthinifaciens]